MIGHNYIVTAKRHQGADADYIDQKCREWSDHVRDSWSKCKNAVNNGKQENSVRVLNTEVCVAEDHHGKKDNDPYDTVVFPEYFCVNSDKYNTECYCQ